MSNDSCTYDVLGCTYPEADNYSPSANVDDGSCELPEGEVECPFDTDGNGLVGYADLLEFLAAYSYPCPLFELNTIESRVEEDAAFFLPPFSSVHLTRTNV